LLQFGSPKLPIPFAVFRTPSLDDYLLAGTENEIMAEHFKRKGAPGANHDHSKRAKTRGKAWKGRAPRRTEDGALQRATSIEVGDAGIWATCTTGKEGKCVGELRDLLEEYAEKLNLGQNPVPDGDTKADAPGDADGDIASSIQKEVRELKQPAAEKLFTAVRIDVQCLVFFKTKASIDPVALVHRICEDAASQPDQQRSRYIQRLTPVTLFARATEEGLAHLAATVLAPHFHGPEVTSKKFAIRPTIRSSNQMKRDAVIQTVAAAVGPKHQVDLKNYDRCILVEIFKGHCGMSVVPGDYEKLRRFNLAEIHEPTVQRDVEAPKTQTEKLADAGTSVDAKEETATEESAPAPAPPSKASEDLEE
ncbi:MAG: hypothetical protein M1823_006107, partial [Watsoniomyces obsoletus]